MKFAYYPGCSARSTCAELNVATHLVASKLGLDLMQLDSATCTGARELRAIDPTSAVERITTMTNIRRESVAARTFAMRLLIGFAVVATLLAVVGLYGVLSLSVNSRMKEIAVRKAVGAQRHQIVGLVLGEGSKLVMAGLLLGTAAAVLVGRLLQTLLFDVTPTDPLALGIAGGAFGAVALTVCLLPAFRASRVDLMASLRQE